MIKLSNISKSFNHGKTFCVNNVSLTIESGETLVILGSSGSGKTSTLKMINRLIEPTSGSIEIDGQDIKSYDPIQLRRSFGYAFQGVGLFPHMTIAENIAIVLRLLNHPKKERISKAQSLLELVNLDPKLFANRYPDELSGGQQQRVGVARALSTDPNCLLMDEPFGALDAINRNDLQEELIRIKKELNKTVVFVTHDILEAARIADRIAVMHNGNLEQVGSKENIINNPATKFVKTLFEKSTNQFEEYREHKDE